MSLGAVQERATCVFPAVPVTSVGMAAACAIDEEDATTTVAKSVDETRANAKEPRNALLQYLVTFANTFEVYSSKTTVVKLLRVNPYLLHAILLLFSHL